MLKSVENSYKKPAAFKIQTRSDYLETTTNTQKKGVALLKQSLPAPSSSAYYKSPVKQKPLDAVSCNSTTSSAILMRELQSVEKLKEKTKKELKTFLK